MSSAMVASSRAFSEDSSWLCFCSSAASGRSPCCQAQRAAAKAGGRLLTSGSSAAILRLWRIHWPRAPWIAVTAATCAPAVGSARAAVMVSSSLRAVAASLLWISC
jgi:hypothetical protein